MQDEEKGIQWLTGTPGCSLRIPPSISHKWYVGFFVLVSRPYWSGLCCGDAWFPSACIGDFALAVRLDHEFTWQLMIGAMSFTSLSIFSKRLYRNIRSFFTEYLHTLSRFYFSTVVNGPSSSRTRTSSLYSKVMIKIKI